MKNHKLPFVNYYTLAEVKAFSGLSEPRECVNIKIKIPIEKNRFAYFELQAISHFNWDYKSRLLEFYGTEEERDEVIKKALVFLQEQVGALTQADVMEQSTIFMQRDRTLNIGHNRLFTLLSRPFMYPFTHLEDFLNRLGQFQCRNTEMELLYSWRDDNRNNSFYTSEVTLRGFVDTDIADLHTMPEVIPAMYKFMEVMNDGGLPALALEKIRKTHGPNDPKRARVEAVLAVWEENWDPFLHWYAKIPLEMHDWDPVPRYFLPNAINACFNDWDAVLETYNEITYYGGIPLYLLYSMKGCWEVERGDFKVALESKLVAYRSGISKEYISIQLAVIYNKLGMHNNVLTLLTVDVLKAIYGRYEPQHLDAAVTQLCIAFRELDDAELTAAFEARLNTEYLKAVRHAYRLAADKHYTPIQDQTPLKRALEGCMGS